MLIPSLIGIITEDLEDSEVTEATEEVMAIIVMEDLLSPLPLLNLDTEVMEATEEVTEEVTATAMVVTEVDMEVTAVKVVTDGADRK
jgi:hypothetical protein